MYNLQASLIRLHNIVQMRRRQKRTINMFNQKPQSCIKLQSKLFCGSIILIICLACLYFALFASRCAVESNPYNIETPDNARDNWHKRAELLLRSDVVNFPNNPNDVSLTSDVNNINNINNISSNCHSLYRFDKGTTLFGNGVSFTYEVPFADLLLSTNNEKQFVETFANLDFLVAILSYSFNFDQREWIRNTWLQYDLKFKPYFIVAERMLICDDDDDEDTDTLISDSISDSNSRAALLKNNNENVLRLKEEYSQYKDIIILNTIEDYDTVLQYKTLSMFQIFEKYFLSNPNPKYTFSNIKAVLKTDDDSYMRLPIINWEINNQKNKLHKKKFYFGRCFENRKIPGSERDPKQSKTPISYSMWPHKIYPNYCVGMGYVVSMSLLSCINSHVTTKQGFYYMPIEDMSTGIHISFCNVTATSVFYLHAKAKAVWENNPNPVFKEFKKYGVYHEIKQQEIFDRLWKTEKEYKKG